MLAIAIIIESKFSMLGALRAARGVVAELVIGLTVSA